MKDAENSLKEIKEKRKIKHLYVHIPFCTHICPYCSFYKTKNSLPDMKQFVPALQQELEWAVTRFDLQPETVFWGGGTPSALSLSQLKEIFACWPWKGKAGNIKEFTMEANPMTISPQKAELLLEAGVNRISLGVQAFDEASLKILGRTHDEEQVQKTVALLKKAGFENVNIDLMFALPGQHPDQWIASLQKAIDLEPTHVSSYNLTYEEDTDFFRKLELGEWAIDEKQEREFFLKAIDILERAGFVHYETSNFARSGWESLHNQAYWKGVDYLGLGPSAYSTIGNERWQNVADTKKYAEFILERNGQEGLHSEEKLTYEIKRKERIMLGLRMKEGVSRSEISEKEEQKHLEHLEKEGLITLSPDRVRLTREGKLKADQIAELFM